MIIPVSKESGVYQIKNQINGKVYIGSTKCFQARGFKHLEFLKKNIHQKRLQNAWNKYGEKNFAFEILEVVVDKKKLIEREQYYLDVVEPWSQNIGYNCRKIAQSNLGIKFVKKNRLVDKPIYQFDKHGNLIKEWETITEASKELQITPNSLLQRTKNPKTCLIKGYIWLLEQETNKIFEASQKVFLKNKTTSKKPIYQFDLQGSLIKKWDSVFEVAITLNYPICNLLACCYNKQKSSHRFVWSFSDSKIVPYYRKETVLTEVGRKNIRLSSGSPTNISRILKLGAEASLRKKGKTYKEIFGEKRSFELRSVLSEKSTQRQAKIIFQLDSTTKQIINQFTSVKEALLSFGITKNTSQIANAIRFKAKFKGYFWDYKEEK